LTIPDTPSALHHTSDREIEQGKIFDDHANSGKILGCSGIEIQEAKSGFKS
jgi:hypothetical protein